jgi:Zn-dependent peptidase ImmA (M78 family)
MLIEPSFTHITKNKEANAFAMELLMPQYKFQEVFNEVRGNIQKVADRFGVSIGAVEARAFMLGLIDNI